MKGKLAFRNAVRSMKDYMIYMLTMAGVSALMFSFNTMIFSEDVQKFCDMALIMTCMIAAATFFIVLIVAWLINYMVRFMLERRSREFGTYLLMGMKKREIARLYMRENIILGCVSFLPGLAAGFFLQQVLMAVFFHIFSQDYRLKLEVSAGCLAMTAGCYFGCYLLALLRNKRSFRKLSVAELMKMEKENEKINTRHCRSLQWLFFLAAAYFAAFDFILLNQGFTMTSAIVMSVMLPFFIYLLYIGLSNFLMRYIQRGGSLIYKGENLFLLRQTACKLKTMRFTQGTLTILFTFALLSCAVSMMLSGYQKQAVKTSMPFDVLIYSSDTQDDFSQELEAIEKKGKIEASHSYYIRQDESSRMNAWLYTHAETLKGQYARADGSLNEEAVLKDGADYSVYYQYDTYMAVSDYNRLRDMLGLEKIGLKGGEYAIQIKPRLVSCLKEGLSESWEAAGESLALAGIYTDGFAQNGINGADYLLIVPDSVARRMTPFYRNLAVSLDGGAEDGLGNDLSEIRLKKNGILSADEYETLVDEGAADWADWTDITLGGQGSDQIIVMISDVLVSEEMGRELIFVMTAITFPLVYISLIFVCVAMTVLAVQQLSDAAKYRYRYEVLSRLGLRQRRLDGVLFKQLFLYYIVPVLAACALSGVIAVYLGNQFVLYTGAQGSGLSYFGFTLAVFLGVYALYFAAAWLGCRRSLAERT